MTNLNKQPPIQTESNHLYEASYVPFLSVQSYFTIWILNMLFMVKAAAQ